MCEASVRQEIQEFRKASSGARPARASNITPQGHASWLSRLPLAFFLDALMMATRDATYKLSAKLFTGLYRLRVERRNRIHSSNTFLMVLAISLFVRGFIAKALIPAAFALSASTT
jgi:hypothetical protein